MTRKEIARAVQFGLDPKSAGIASIKLPLSGGDCPHWISHIELTRKGDQITFEVVKTNGRSFGEHTVDLTNFNDLADQLLTP
jgi:hypothetical protein